MHAGREPFRGGVLTLYQAATSAHVSGYAFPCFRGWRIPLACSAAQLTFGQQGMQHWQASPGTYMETSASDA